MENAKTEKKKKEKVEHTGVNTLKEPVFLT